MAGGGATGDAMVNDLNWDLEIQMGREIHVNDPDTTIDGRNDREGINWGMNRVSEVAWIGDRQGRDDAKERVSDTTHSR